MGVIEKLANPISWNPVLTEHRSREKDKTISEDIFWCGDSSENFQLLDELNPHLLP